MSNIDRHLRVSRRRNNDGLKRMTEYEVTDKRKFNIL